MREGRSAHCLEEVMKEGLFEEVRHEWRYNSCKGVVSAKGLENSVADRKGTACTVSWQNELRSQRKRVEAVRAE